MTESREKLKTFFETNKKPGQEDFEKLIDAFVHKDEYEKVNPEALIAGLSEKTILDLANRIEYSEYPIIRSNVSGMAEDFIDIAFTWADKSEQVLKLTGSSRFSREFRLLSKGLYTLTVKEAAVQTLKENEYISFSISLGPGQEFLRLVGHNLSDLSGQKIEVNEIYEDMEISVEKETFSQSIEEDQGNIRFFNNTSANISYKTTSSEHMSLFRKEDSTFTFYNLSDQVSFRYKADLTNETKKIECKLFNEETGELLSTAFLNPAVNHLNLWGGTAKVDSGKSFRIECDYQ